MKFLDYSRCARRRTFRGRVPRPAISISSAVVLVGTGVLYISAPASASPSTSVRPAVSALLSEYRSVSGPGCAGKVAELVPRNLDASGNAPTPAFARAVNGPPSRTVHWVTSVGCAKGASITPDNLGPNDSYPSFPSANWSGFITPQNSSGETYDGVQANWTFPTAASSPSSAYSSQWIGLGDGSGNNSSNLVQGGTESDSNGSYYPWIEAVPDSYNNYSQIRLTGMTGPWCRCSTRALCRVIGCDIGSDLRRSGRDRLFRIWAILPVRFLLVLGLKPPECCILRSCYGPPHIRINDRWPTRKLRGGNRGAHPRGKQLSEIGEGWEQRPRGVSKLVGILPNK